MENRLSKKYLLILDTSFKSTYLYDYLRNHDIKQLYSAKHWDNVIAAIEDKIPGFENENFTIINTPFANLEFIGLGNLKSGLLKNYNNDEHKKIFPAKSELGIQISTLATQEEKIALLDPIFKKCFEEIWLRYWNHIDIQSIQDQATQKIKNMAPHPYAKQYLLNSIETWIHGINEGKDGSTFHELVWYIAWDTLVRWADIKLQKDILLRLIGWYRDFKKNHPLYENLSGAVLLIKLSSQENNSFECGKELLDTELIEYVCTGFFYEDERKPIIVISADKEKAENRLDNYINAVNYCNTNLRENDKLEFIPGYIILVPKKPANEWKNDCIQLIDVQEKITSSK